MTLSGKTALITGVASESLALDPHRTSRTLFAQAGSVQPMTGLIRV